MVMLSTISCQEGSSIDAAVCGDASIDTPLDAPIDTSVDASVDAEIDATPVDAASDAEEVQYCYVHTDCDTGWCCVRDNGYRICVPGYIVIGMCIPYG